jgi:hypothetical protein
MSVKTRILRAPLSVLYKIAFISNGFKPGRRLNKRAAMPVRCGVAQLVAGSAANTR